MADPIDNQPAVVPAVKPIYQSKTIWVNLLVAILAFFPSIQGFVMSHPEILPMAFAAVNVVLRLFTKSGVQLSDS